MENKSLIQFAEERIEHFRNDLVQANQEENEFSLLLNALHDKKDEYWNQIMEHLKVVTEPDNLPLAYTDILLYHSKFRNMLTGFYNKCKPVG